MKTLQLFSHGTNTVPGSTSWYLADLGEARGKQELFTRQTPQKLKTLREHALIESAVSSNRIEGVKVDPSRVHNLILGKTLLRDRNEEEVRGYRNALKLIHQRGEKLLLTEATIKEMHQLSRGEIWDAGRYKEKNSDIIERYADGSERVRFVTVPVSQTPDYMKQLIKLWGNCLEERWVHPLIALAAFNLDFLCIHPFRDGNGRVSRLILLLQCYHLGYEVGRYISLERLIEQNKERYYETLEQSSVNWHKGKHDPWPYINYLLFILKMAYRELAERVGETKSPRGSKTELVINTIEQKQNEFTLDEIERACPSVSRDMVRRVLREQQAIGLVQCVGRGPRAKWIVKRGNKPE